MKHSVKRGALVLVGAWTLLIGVLYFKTNKYSKHLEITYRLHYGSRVVTKTKEVYGYGVVLESEKGTNRITYRDGNTINGAITAITSTSAPIELIRVTKKQ